MERPYVPETYVRNRCGDTNNILISTPHTTDAALVARALYAQE